MNPRFVERDLTRASGSSADTILAAMAAAETQPLNPDVDEQIRYEVDGGIARLTIAAPDQGNALTPAMRDRLADRFIEISEDLRVRVVVLRGAGDRHFCTGAALGGPQRPAPPKPEGAPERAPGDVARIIRIGWQRLIASILDCEQPVDRARSTARRRAAACTSRSPATSS